MNLSLRHVLLCSAKTYWQCVLDPEYARALFVDRLGFTRYEVVSQRDMGTCVERVVEACPSAKSVPSMLVKTLPYQERGILTWGASSYTFETTHPGARGASVQGIITCRASHPEVASSSVRVSDLRIHVGVPILGGLLERRIADDLTKAYDESARFTQEWLVRMLYESRRSPQ